MALTVIVADTVVAVVGLALAVQAGAPPLRNPGYPGPDILAEVTCLWQPF